MVVRRLDAIERRFAAQDAWVNSDEARTERLEGERSLADAKATLASVRSNLDRRNDDLPRGAAPTS